MSMARPPSWLRMKLGCRWRSTARRCTNFKKDLGERFGLSFDCFGRSHSPQNHEITQHFYHQLDKNGFLEERTTRQVYSIDDGRFLPDRYVVGTCKHCGYERARGDQCENCTRVLDPTDLINPRSAISGSTNHRDPRFETPFSQAIRNGRTLAGMD